jgi:ABC-type Zn2+ transport system substrate-binding protein/surface adhesin
MKTHQKLTVKLTSNSPESEKLDSAWCEFSNRKPTSIHIISTSNNQKHDQKHDRKQDRKHDRKHDRKYNRMITSMIASMIANMIANMIASMIASMIVNMIANMFANMFESMFESIVMRRDKESGKMKSGNRPEMRSDIDRCSRK